MGHNLFKVGTVCTTGAQKKIGDFPKADVDCKVPALGDVDAEATLLHEASHVLEGPVVDVEVAVLWWWS